MNKNKKEELLWRIHAKGDASYKDITANREDCSLRVISFIGKA